MRIRRETPSNLRERNNVIEVKFWDAYFRHRRPVFEKIVHYSIDKRALTTELDKLSFRFTIKEWNETVKQLLTEHNIPVIELRHVFDSHFAELS